MKKVDFNKLQAGDLVEVPRTQFAPMRRGWNGWLFSEAVVIRKGVGRKSKKNVVVVEMRTPAGKNSYGTIEARAYAYRFTPQKRGVSMGEFNTVGLEDIIDAFSRREAATVEAVPKMLKAGADVLIEAQRAEAQAMGLNETGGFINSIKATDVKGDDTEKYVEIYPQGRAKHGNDRKGDKSKVRYATIGFVAEYGTSSHAARPYMTVANEKAHEKVVEAQRSIWESETGE